MTRKRIESIVARRWRDWLLLAALIVALTVYAYVVAGAIGARIGVNEARTPPVRGTAIFVEDNGIHTSIVVPKAALDPDWRARFAASDLADPRFADHPSLAFSWGDRAFFLETPRWADLRPATVVRAAIGSDDTVLHVEHVAPPVADARVRRIVLAPDELARLTAYLEASLAEGPAARGYGAHDAFYPARGHYNARVTCNEWTARGLRQAGVPMGSWTPMSMHVMRWL
ncbi:TIGR02117 family protein [Sphingomonas baiyangensis]|uniref:TIGR02117 family protein n=2 Tax=Sphingomonas baiyangensis TaxID=2572576 RepID=A0A4U1L8R8_9SPHN|nr:TIGR02117 family protein [Sphingomonas baiyangensis]